MSETVEIAVVVLICYYDLHMLPQSIAFVDIETTGTRSFYDRIIEIGIVKVENNKIVDTYHSLVNPETYLPPIITTITGIVDKDLENAPTFRQIKRDVLEQLVDCVFVAHNVRFDYSFLKNEFQREEISFSSRHFCTVRLSRLLYPHFPRHNLDTIIQQFNIPVANRHRALDDAKVLFEFYQHMQKDIAPELLEQAIAKSLKQPSIPLKLSKDMLDKLPEKPGVYLFYGGDGSPLYVGKSKNIKNRVLDHFSSDIHSPTEMKISQQIESIETITTAGEIGALVLESQLIKKMLPLYNKKSRLKRELIAAKSELTREGYQQVYLEPITSIPATETLNSFLGFFKSRKQAKTFLTELAKKYGLCEKLLGLENTKDACFAHRLDRCKGACIGEEKNFVYNMKFLAAFSKTKIQSWPFTGPILIQEEELGGNKEYFLINNWCYLGSAVVDQQGNIKDKVADNQVFDLDIYQILKQQLKKLKPQMIRQLPTDSTNLSQYLSSFSH